MLATTPTRSLPTFGSWPVIKAEPLSDADRLQRRADLVARGGARAAVLGANDGLISNLSLILGVAGASASQGAVRLAGFASLVAGALSMAAGEWVSVRAQVDLYRGVLDELRTLVDHSPALVLDRLSAELEDIGMDTDTAMRAATEIPLDEASFLSFTARTVFGINSDELGNPVTAALSSLVLFAVGALVPLMPWFFTRGIAGATWSFALTAIGALFVGGYVSRSAGMPQWKGALRQFLIVAAAAGVTYGIGKLAGTAIG
jgi:vacuolar iron transporter family protein